MFTLVNPLGSENLIELLGVIIDGLIRLAIPITVIMIIWAGVLYMTSGGAERIKTATKALVWAMLGFGILLIASGVVAIIQNFLGVTPGGVGVATMGPTTLEEVLKILTDISGWLFTFAIVAGAAMLIVAGLTYIFARGDPTQAGKALKMLLYSSIGIGIAALAWSIINIVARFLTGATIFATIIPAVYAQTSVPIAATRPGNAPTGGPTSITDIFILVQDAVGWLFVFTIVFGVAVIIISGIMYLFTGGDGARAKTAAKTLLYAFIGIAIAALAWAIVNLIGNFFVGDRLLL